MESRVQDLLRQATAVHLCTYVHWACNMWQKACKRVFGQKMKDEGVTRSCSDPSRWTASVEVCAPLFQSMGGISDLFM